MDIIQKNVRSLSSTDIVIGTHNNIVRAIPHWSLEKGINHSLSKPNIPLVIRAGLEFQIYLTCQVKF
jgi:hypothetical protein